MHSKFNPKLGKWIRASNFEERCDGAGAFVVMPTEMAYKYTDHPIEILGVGYSVVEYANPQKIADIFQKEKDGNKCNHIEFPPYLACNACGNLNTIREFVLAVKEKM